MTMNFKRKKIVLLQNGDTVSNLVKNILIILIILISFLLLSSPVIGDNHKGETLYRWGKTPDYKWMGFGDKETHAKFQGQVKESKPNGLGFMTYPNGSKYVGSWNNGKYHGQGTLTSPDVGKWEGKWKDGYLWNGTKYDKDGKIKDKIVNGKWIKQ